MDAAEAQEPPPEEARAELLETINAQIIPRLVEAHRADDAPACACPETRVPPTADEVSELAAIALSQDMSRALAVVERLASEGLALETILLHLVAPAARRLGDQWQADELTFNEVAIGLVTLQQLVHVLGPRMAAPVAHRGFVVLVAAPSEQHTLGIYILGELLRRAAWAVQVAPAMSNDELFTLVAGERVDMVGITTSSADQVPPLAKLVLGIKASSKNPDVKVVLGGSLSGLADVAPQIGARFCPDPRSALQWLEQSASRRGTA